MRRGVYILCISGDWRQKVKKCKTERCRALQNAGFLYNFYYLVASLFLHPCLLPMNIEQ
jgi:hypothetical protein